MTFISMSLGSMISHMVVAAALGMAIGAGICYLTMRNNKNDIRTV